MCIAFNFSDHTEYEELLRCHYKSGNILETVQDIRHCFYWPLIGNSVWLVNHHHFWWILSYFQIIHLLQAFSCAVFAYSIVVNMTSNLECQNPSVTAEPLCYIFSLLICGCVFLCDFWWNIRVHTDPVKVCKLLELIVEIFKVLKCFENDHRYGKFWNSLCIFFDYWISVHHCHYRCS